MKRVLITGSEGFVGQHLWKELETNGYQVFGTTLHEPQSGLPKNVFLCNILERDALNNLVGDLKPEVIVHLAAQPKPGLSFSQPQLTFEINTIGTINLFEAVKALDGYRPRILLLGTSEEHGLIPESEMPITETTSLNPINPYSISKLANWFLAKQYVRSFNFDIVYVTPFTHTGPNQGLGFLSTDVASQIVAIERGEADPIISTGDLSSQRDISDVRDVVRAYRLLIEKGQTGERYIVGSGKSIPVSQIVDILVSLAKVPVEHKIDPQKTRPSDIKVLYGSHDKLSNLTGWQPEIPLEKTLEDLLDSYRKLSA